jgi:hypothetical protein
MDFFAGCADETADKNGGAVIILVVAFDDPAVHRDAGLICQYLSNRPHLLRPTLPVSPVKG